MRRIQQHVVIGKTKYRSDDVGTLLDKLRNELTDKGVTEADVIGIQSEYFYYDQDMNDHYNVFITATYWEPDHGSL